MTAAEQAVVVSIFASNVHRLRLLGEIARRRGADVPGRLVFTLSDAPSPDDEARTVLTVRLRAVDGGTEQEFRQTGVVTDEHFNALKAGTEMFFTRLGEFLAR